jgi:hypothetical protein
MKHLFVPYELALLAKEKGFNEPCIYQYYKQNEELLPIVKTTQYPTIRNNSEISIESGEDCIAAPIYQQLIDWFREEHDIHFEIFPTRSFRLNPNYCYSIDQINRSARIKKSIPENSLTLQADTYYNALNAALAEAFKLINPITNEKAIKTQPPTVTR